MKNNTVQKNMPQGWELKNLSDLVLIKKGEQLNRLAMDNSGKYLALNGGISPSGYTDKWNTEANTITISEGGNSCGYVNFNKEKFWCGGHCYALLNLQKSINKDFLYQALKSKQDKLMKLRVGSGLPNIQKRSIEEFKLIIPHVNEQKKIAEILGAVDEDIAKTEEVIEVTEKLKRGLMQKLFMPKKGWVHSFLSEVATIIMGQSPNSKNYNETNQGLPLIQGNADIKNRQSIKRFSTSEITKKINKGDIIMSVRAPVGCIAIASFDSCIGRGVCGIHPKEIDRDYLYYYLINQEDKLEQKAQGSTFTAINSNEVRKIKIIFPEKKEKQKQIAEILSSVDGKISVNKKLKEKLTLLKKGLMQDLLSGKKRTV